MEIKSILELARAVRENGLTRLELRDGEFQLLIERGAPALQTHSLTPLSGSPDFTKPDSNPSEEILPASPVSPVSSISPDSQNSTVLPDSPIDETAFVQKSPIVGTIYLSPESGAAPFTSVGARVSRGDVLCLIEAMKMYNEIGAEKDGVIAEICVKSESPVEFGQPIFKIL